MKKIISLLLIFSLFFSVNIFADRKDDNFQNKYEQGCAFLENKEYKKAYKYLNYVAEKDKNIDRNCDAKISLAAMYYDGTGVEQDYKKAYEYCNYVIDNSTKKENICAAYSIIAIMYCFGYGVEPNYEKAYEACNYIIEEDISKEGTCVAKSILSYIYYHGYGVEKDYKKAYDFANFVVENCTDKETICLSRLVLGAIYFDGFGIVEPSFEELYKNYNYVLENSSNVDLIVASEFILATIYLTGVGAETNYKKAKEYLENILESGINNNLLKEILKIENVKFTLARIYLLGGYGVEQDYKKACNLYKEVLNGDIKDEDMLSETLYLLGLMYCDGYADEIDFVKGFNYIKKAASLGNESANKLMAEINQDGIAKTFIGFERLTLFDNSSVDNIIRGKELKVFQVLDSSIALATIDEGYSYVVVLLIGTHYDYFYDDQKIKVPSGKQIKQIGIYKYESKGGMYKTVPTVAIQQI